MASIYRSYLVIIFLLFSPITYASELLESEDTLRSMKVKSAIVDYSNYLKEAFSSDIIIAFADQLAQVVPDLIIEIMPTNPSSELRTRQSAFYSRPLNTIFLHSNIANQTDIYAEGLYLHEVLGILGIGDSDYQLSQMITVIKKLTTDSKVPLPEIQKKAVEEFLEKEVISRTQFNVAFSNDIPGNKALLLDNGASIVGGGGDYSDAFLKGQIAFMQLDLQRSALSKEYFDNNPQFLPEIISDNLRKNIPIQLTCIPRNLLLIRSNSRMELTNGQFDFHATSYIYYSKKTRLDLIVATLRDLTRRFLFAKRDQTDAHRALKIELYSSENVGHFRRRLLELGCNL